MSEMVGPLRVEVIQEMRVGGELIRQEGHEFPEMLMVRLDLPGVWHQTFYLDRETGAAMVMGGGMYPQEGP